MQEVPPRIVEQGQVGRPEGAIQAEGSMFNLELDSKLRACDLVKLKVCDICHGDRVAARAIIMQQKTSRPVQVEITGSTHKGGQT